jgi:hypothetical protein
MEEVISQTSKAFLDFQETFLRSNVLDQVPELGDSFHSTAETIFSLTQAIAPDRGIDNNSLVLCPLQIQDGDADQKRIKRLATEEQHPSAHHLLEKKARKGKTVRRNARGQKASDREGVSTILRDLLYS